MVKGKVSIKDIAQLSGVSVATVSRVINHNGRFSKETEQRVLEAIDKYNYVPNELARGLRTDRALVIGVVVPDITHGFFAEMVRTIEMKLLEEGYMAFICDTGEKADLIDKYLAVFSSMNISGIIYIGGGKCVKPDKNIPMVYVDRPPLAKDGEISCFVGSDNYQGSVLAAERLIQSGKKNLVMVSRRSSEDIRNSQARESGFRQTLMQYGFDCHENRIFIVDDDSMESGYAITKVIFEKNPETDGIFYYCDALAIGGLRYLNEQRTEVPGKVALIGMDDIPMASMVTPPLTTIRQSREELSEKAVAAIIRMIRGEDYKDIEIVPVSLVDRQTVSACNDDNTINMLSDT